MNPKTETSYGTPTHRISFVYPTCRALNKQLRVFSHFGHDLRGGAYTGTAPWPLAGKKWGQRIWSQERFLHTRLSAFADGQSPPKTTTPSDADIRQILVDRIDLQHQSVGIVVGVIGPAGRRVMPMGIWRRTIHVRSTATRYSKLARQRRCSRHCCWPTWRSAAKSRCAIL